MIRNSFICNKLSYQEMIPTQQSKGFKGSQIPGGYVIPSEYPNNPYSVKKLKDQTEQKKRPFDKATISLPAESLEQPRKIVSLDKKTPKSTERLPKGSAPNIPRRYSQDASPKHQIFLAASGTTPLGATPQGNYRTHKIPVTVTQGGVQYASERSNGKQSSLNVTGSTIGKPVTGQRAENGRFINGADLGTVSHSPIPGDSRSYHVDTVQLEPQLGPRQGTVRFTNQSHGPSVQGSTDNNDRTSDTKFLEHHPDIQQLRDVISSEQYPQPVPNLSALTSGDQSMKGLETRNDSGSQIVALKRTVVATGSFNNEHIHKRDPSEENLNLALVLVTDGAEQGPPYPFRTDATTQSPKTMNIGVGADHQSDKKGAIVKYENNRDISIILPQKKITRKRQKGDVFRSTTSVSAQPSSLRKNHMKSEFSMRTSPNNNDYLERRSVQDSLMNTMNDRQLSLNALDRYKKQRQRYMSTGTACNGQKVASEEDDIEHRTGLIQKLLGNSKEARQMKSKFTQMIRVPQERFSLPAFKKLSQELRGNVQHPHQVYKQQLTCNPKHIQKLTQVEDLVQVLPTSTESYSKLSVKYSNTHSVAENHDSLYSVTDLPSALALDYEHPTLSITAPFGSSAQTLPLYPIAAASQESPEDAAESSQENAGIFITNEESFADLTSLPPKFQDHKQSTPLPALNGKVKKSLQGLRKKSKKSSVEYSTQDIVPVESSTSQLLLKSEQNNFVVVSRSPHISQTNLHSKEFECKESDKQSLTSIMSTKKFHSNLKQRPYNVEHDTSRTTKVAELSQEEMQSLNSYTIKISSNMGGERSKTNMYRKSNMSNILGRESRILKKLQKRVEEQYKLSDAQLQARRRNFQTQSKLDELEAKEAKIKFYINTPVNLISKNASSLALQNQNKIMNDSGYQVSTQEVSQGQITGVPTGRSRADQENFMKEMLPAYQNVTNEETDDQVQQKSQLSSSVSPWKKDSDLNRYNSITQNSSIPTMDIQYGTVSPRQQRGKSTEEVKRKLTKKIREKQQVWPSETSKNHAKNFTYLQQHKDKRQLVNTYQISKILRHDMSNFDQKEEPVVIVPVPVPAQRVHRKKKSVVTQDNYQISEEELLTIQKMLATPTSQQECTPTRSPGRVSERMGNNTYSSGASRNIVTYEARLDPKLVSASGGAQTEFMQSKEESQKTAVQASNVGNLDVITEGMSNNASRFMLHNRSSHTIEETNAQGGVETRESVNSKEQRDRNDSDELQVQSIPKINIKHQGAVDVLTRNEIKLDKQGKKIMTQNINTSSATQIVTTESSAYPEEDTVPFPLSTNQHLRDHSQQSIGTKKLEDAQRNSSMIEQMGSINNSSQLTHQTRSDYLHRDIISIQRQMNGRSRPQDLANVRIRGKNILDQAQIAENQAKHSHNSSFDSQNVVKYKKIREDLNKSGLKVSSHQVENIELISPSKFVKKESAFYQSNQNQTDVLVSSGRNQDNSDRYYIKVPITEVIIKTAVPANNESLRDDKSKESNQKNKRNVHKLNYGAKPSKSSILNKDLNKDLVSDHTEEHNHITGEISHTSGFIESIYRTDHAGTGNTFEPMYGQTNQINFKPPSMYDVLGSSQEKKEYSGQRSKKGAQTNMQQAKLPLLFEPSIVSVPQNPQKPQQERKFAGSKNIHLPEKAITVKSAMMVGANDSGISSMKLVSNKDVISQQSGTGSYAGRLDQTNIEKAYEDDKQIQADMSIEENYEGHQRVTSRGDRMVKRPPLEKQTIAMSQVNMGVNFEIIKNEYEPLEAGKQTNQSKQSPYAITTKNLAKFKQSPPRVPSQPESPQLKSQKKTKKRKTSNENIGVSRGYDDQDSNKHMSGSIRYGKDQVKGGFKDSYFKSQSQGYLNLTIRNGKLRSSVDTKDLKKTTLPKIKINKIQVGAGMNFTTVDKADFNHDADLHLQTQLQSDREHQRSSERVKHSKKRKTSNPYNKDAHSSTMLIPADSSFQIVSLNQDRGRVSSVGQLEITPMKEHGSIGDNRSNSQSQVTPLQAKMQFTSEHTNSMSVISNPHQLYGLGLTDPVIMHTNLSPAVVQSILDADPNAIVTLVVPDDDGEVPDRKFKL